MILVVLIQNACTGKEAGRWYLGQFENSDVDKALALAKSNWEVYKNNVIQCPDNRPQYRVWAYFGSADTFDAFLFEDGKQYPRTVLRVTLETGVNSPECERGPRTKLKEFPEEQLAQATDAANGYWSNYRSTKHPCWVQGAGGPVLTEVNKYDVCIYRFTDGQYGSAPIYSALRDSAGGTGAKKISTGDDIMNPSTPNSAGPSGLQIAGAIALAGAVAYGTWKVTGAMLDKEPSRRTSLNPSNMSDTERARKIVKLAVKKTKIRSVKHWLDFDEHGVWEKQAKEYLEATEPRANSIGMSVDEVDDQIAQYIAYLAAEATLRDAKKRARK